MDLNFINKHENTLDLSEEYYEISADQKNAIERSRLEIENGQFHKNEEVISEMRKWLNNLSV